MKIVQTRFIASLTNNQLTAIVLAGGQSSRMGEDKALIPIQGIPMLQRVCSIAQACADTVYVVTPWPERYQHLLLPGCQFIPETPISPSSSSHGPLVGFSQGLAQVQTDWVLLLACDLPNLKVEVLQEWIARLDTVGDDAIAALAHHAKGWEPLCGFYRRRCLPQLLEFINQGGRSFQQWLKQHSVQVLPVLEPEMLFNCNTPEDLAGNE
ncbi:MULTISPECIES: molybdenum cofactor guanylyltransferase [Calothrix]|uniref:Probable molybdenum cofactor guanylyltransferase n=2 Tax=Calothrix TaxID=1186 RepID=A0ABR8AAZ7_9CYAN|nr:MULTISPECIES: molybdenum cofactor guanylyltransferase [Calothrix]MBD2197132.1 molybdenum cofactor guanylyltransferase [Calothrix parietina FACHB-288]MBD2225778.1 molybdenum cofactor guanylyltransferase [Calothrix anomala FACHB-343]